MGRGTYYDAWVPAKRTREGKELAVRMKAAKLIDPRDHLPGMPSEVSVPSNRNWGSFRLIGPGMRADADPPTLVWLHWEVDPEAKEVNRFGSALAKVDRKLWTKAKLSEYYLFIEAQEAKAG